MKKVLAAVFALLSLLTACGCDKDRDRGKIREEHEDEKTVRAAEVRGEAAHTLQCLEEAISRAGPFVSRMQEIEEHGTWLFEEGPLAMSRVFRNSWWELKRTVPELIEPAKAIARSLLGVMADLAYDGELTRIEAARVRRIIYRGNELAAQIASAVHARNVTLTTRIEPALSRYPLPPPEARMRFPAERPGGLLLEPPAGAGTRGANP